MNHVNITSKEGFDAIMSSEANRDRYIDMVASLVGNDENTKNIIKDVARHTMEDVKSGFSTEAADAMANNAAYSTLAKLNTWVIVGYTARSKCLEMYHTFSSDDPTVSFKYNLDYIVKGKRMDALYFREPYDANYNPGHSLGNYNEFINKLKNAFFVLMRCGSFKKLEDN
jgi:hypothetical protein